MQSVSLSNATAKNWRLELLTRLDIKSTIQKVLISTLKCYHQLQKALLNIFNAPIINDTRG